MNASGLLIGQVALTALVHVAFAFAIGSTLFERWLAADGALARTAPSHAAWHRARASLMAAAFALVLAEGGWLLYEAGAMTGAGVAGGLAALPDVVGTTHVGHAWCVAFAGAAWLLMAALLSRGGRFGAGMFWLGALASAAGTAAIGHAADAGMPSLGWAMQAVHVLATAVWGGVVLAGGLVVLPALDTSITRIALIRLADRVSNVSLAAFCVVLISGLVGAQRGLGGSLAALRGTAWGHVLTLKLALVLLAVVLGALNRTSALPRLRRSASTLDAHTFRNVLHLEALVMVAIFVTAAVLGLTPPGHT